MSQREIDQAGVRAGVESFPAEASVLFDRVWATTGRGGPSVDAWDCAQAIIPTDLKQVARMNMIQFGVYSCADRIFMLADMYYNQTTGALLRARERALFSDNGLVSYFIRQYADQFGYAVQERGTSLDTTERMFRLKRVRVLPMLEVQLMDLEPLMCTLKQEAGFRPDVAELTEAMRAYLLQRHEVVHGLSLENGASRKERALTKDGA